MYIILLCSYNIISCIAQLQLLPLHFEVFVKMVALYPFASQEELQMKLWQSRQKTDQVLAVSTDSIMFIIKGIYRMSSNSHEVIGELQ